MLKYAVNGIILNTDVFIGGFDWLMIISEIANGVEGCFIKSNKFKTSSISVNMFIPADEKSVSAYSLLYLILTESIQSYYFTYFELS